ncbi:sulfatase [candidate division CSSED10-310 bacterium]|uniref:Sulfatase n=1 Tax=candidate division CSSED10-310 bacterium TaxID=2855610 RepID=A0ABV6Z072_UNCC1
MLKRVSKIIKHNFSFMVWVAILWSVGEIIQHTSGAPPQIHIVHLFVLVLHSFLIYFLNLVIVCLAGILLLTFLGLFLTIGGSISLDQEVRWYRFFIVLMVLISGSLWGLSSGDIKQFLYLTFPMIVLFYLFISYQRSSFMIVCALVVPLGIYLLILGRAITVIWSAELSETVSPSNNLPGSNVILISIDTLRADHLGCYGDPTTRTPTIDRFSRSATLHVNAVTSIALTVPAHATMLTGLYPAEHGCHSNGDPVKNVGLSLPQMLQNQGYQAAAIVSGYPLKRNFFSIGTDFLHYDDKFSPAWFPPDEIFLLPPVRLMANYGLFYDRRFLFERRGFRVNKRAAEYVRKLTTPFFLFLHYYEPHGPYEPPWYYSKYYYTQNIKEERRNSMQDVTFPAYQRLKGIRDIQYPLALYRAEVSYVDKLIGELFTGILPEAVLQNAIICITADHGESLDEHQYYFDHGRDCYEPSAHIPLIIRATETQWGKMDLKTSSLANLVPLLLRLLNQNNPEPVIRQPLVLQPAQSQSIFPIPLEANSNLLDHSSAESNVKPVSLFRGVKYGHFKYLEDLNTRSKLLFNVTLDPGETVDFSKEFPGLKARLEAWSSEWFQRVETNRSAPLVFSGAEKELLTSLGYIQ